MDFSYLLNFLLGLLLGAAGGVLGIGGGLIAIPILGYLHGMDQHLAQGTALIMIAPNVLLGFWRYHQRHNLPLLGLAGGGMSGLFTVGAGLVVVPGAPVALGTYPCRTCGLAGWHSSRAGRPAQHQLGGRARA